MSPLVATCALIEKDGKLLIINHSYNKGYGFPGGRVENNENIEDALAREIREETNLSILSSKYFVSHWGTEYGLSVISISFLVEFEGKIKPSIEGEAVWMKPEDLKGHMSYENADKILDDYIKFRTI